VSYQDLTGTQESEITYNLTQIQSIPKKLVPFPENSQKCLNSLNKESSDAKSTTDENESQQPEVTPASNLPNNSNEFEAKINFVGEGMKNSGVPLRPKSKKELPRHKNSKKTKSTFAKYISDDAEFNSLRSFIQQQDLNNYFSAINSNLTSSKGLDSPPPKISEFSDFRFQKFNAHHQPDTLDVIFGSASILRINTPAQEHTGL
jgi:hypothetical protein